MRRKAIVLVLALSVSVPVSVAKTSLDTAWLDRAVTVDGDLSEWDGAMVHLEGPGLSIGLRNDAGFLYLSLHAPDPQVGFQAMSQGLKLELHPKGSKPFTIQFPVGMLEAGIAPPSRRDPASRERMREQARKSLDSFLLLGPGSEDRQRIAVENSLGIELRASSEGGEFAYELKVPLRKSELHPYAIGAEPGTTVSVALDTLEIDREAMRERMGGMRPGGTGGGRGGMGRPGGGMGGRPGGPGGGRDPGQERPEPLKIRAKVHLAEQPD